MRRVMERLSRSIIAGLALSSVLLFGQNSPADQAKLAAGQQSFTSRCAGCHGADAHGSDRGPALAGNRRVRSRSPEQLGAYIRKGAPASGMPAFDLPVDELDALAALLRSLNAPAAEAVAFGDPAAGKTFFH